MNERSLTVTSAPHKTRVQTGFPAKLTSTYDAATGYDWEMLILDVSGDPVVTDVSSPMTGAYAFTPDDNQSLAVDTAGWLEPDPQGRGWIFLPSEVTAAGSITVAEVDGAPSYSGITTLRFDQADGFVVSQPGAGIARIDQTAASSSTVGYVDKLDQWLGGSSGTAIGTVKEFSLLSVATYSGAGSEINVFSEIGSGTGLGFLSLWSASSAITSNADGSLADGQLYLDVLRANTGVVAGLFNTLAGGTGYFANSVQVIDGSGFFRPVSSNDAGAPNNSIYFSTDANKLVYKDAGGTPNALY